MMQDFSSKNRGQTRSTSARTSSTSTSLLTPPNRTFYRFHEANDPLKFELRTEKHPTDTAGPKPQLGARLPLMSSDVLDLTPLPTNSATLLSRLTGFMNCPSRSTKPRLSRPLLLWPGRTTFDTKMWSRIDCTPYGRYDRILPSKPSLVGPSNEPFQFSQICFDHYAINRDYQTLLRELPRGKRTQAQQPSRIFENLQS